MLPFPPKLALMTSGASSSPSPITAPSPSELTSPSDPLTVKSMTIIMSLT